MSTITIQKQISIEPCFLNKDLTKHLHAKILSTLKNQCDQKYGYILEIGENITILGNIVSSAGKDVFFDVKFTAKTLKPTINSEYEGIVVMVLQQCIFVLVGQMKVVVPTDKMIGFKFNKAGSSFVKGSQTIKQNSKVVVRIENIKYEKQNFNCIGSLKTLL